MNNNEKGFKKCANNIHIDIFVHDVEEARLRRNLDKLRTRLSDVELPEHGNGINFLVL
jgi:hypothetical protein